MGDEPAFARSGLSDPAGKLDARLDIPVTEEMREDANFVARACGFTSVSEWGRDVLKRELYGRVDTIQKIIRGAGNVNGKNLG